MLLADLVHRPIVPIVDGAKSQLQPVSRENVVRAMAASVTMPETQGQVYEVGGPDRVQLLELIERVARHYEVWPNYVRVSSRVMKPMVKALQGFRSFPLTYDELLLMLEDNVCDNEHFTSTFDISLDSYRDRMESLLDTVERKSA
jgi:NADH dehydrogenase